MQQQQGSRDDGKRRTAGGAKRRRFTAQRKCWRARRKQRSRQEWWRGRIAGVVAAVCLSLSTPSLMTVKRITCHCSYKLQSLWGAQCHGPEHHKLHFWLLLVPVAAEFHRNTFRNEIFCISKDTELIKQREMSASLRIEFIGTVKIKIKVKSTIMLTRFHQRRLTTVFKPSASHIPMFTVHWFYFNLTSSLRDHILPLHGHQSICTNANNNNNNNNIIVIIIYILFSIYNTVA